ncbi:MULTISPECIES: APC family permease [Pandoraea]|jgi:amino acid transporter|uniref:Amino acid permease n=2 Tax=Pandoraea TaxID=93217 RepID=A0ABY6WFU7_9BURK|nr:MULTISPECIES: APC family permease [Pandoraea]AHB05938.1 amino acid permease [Pandoraea pnomenusa 3kgm]AHB77993.1 amino acid permease [Pandoraea pnomenusa]AHN73712.1 amino acid permease [Pandoraea pnomenusa]ANC46669.1 amino acid permease [Pandoraea pnomenusa]MBN9094941.1 APC family permease [Pandoraea pnomenusa]
MDQPVKLNANSLGLVESVIMGIAGTAPAYSIEITTSTIIGTSGTLSAASILVCGLIMFGIAFAFINMNRAVASAGTSYSWVSMVFGRTLGFFAGWALLVLCCVFMVSAMIPAANATLLIFDRPMMNNVHYVTLIAAAWLTVVSAVVVKGIKLTSYVQVLMTIVEGVILLAIIVASFLVFPHAPQHPFELHWFSPLAFTPAQFANGALVAIFFFYGWDVTMNLSEETRDSNRTPGRAAFWSMVFLMVFFLVFIVITLLGLSDAEIQHYNTNIIFAISEKLFGQTWGYVAIVAVLLSTVGTVETQVLQFTRTLFAKSRDGALHHRYARLHARWQTPHIAIFFIWVAGMALLLMSSYLPTINVILQDSITAIGFQICFYLGLTGLACGWYYRKSITKGPWTAVTHVIWPVASGLFLFFIALYSIPTFDWVTNVVGMGGIAIGVIPLLANRKQIWRASPG